ncbi:hypothetical protein T03_17483 [Trichinella britovi]|uniref:Uncharacterized protein n=1 Tax=Trichinella britovi TaxID=45882 RepID=A0A0V1DD10_TRIBR|nr:hypothetical protein T03_17483 [Trichinella britovi]
MTRRNGDLTWGIPEESTEALIRNQFITDIRQEAVFEQLVRRELANFEVAHVEAQEAEQTEAALCLMRLDRYPPATSPGQCGCCRRKHTKPRAGQPSVGYVAEGAQQQPLS